MNNRFLLHNLNNDNVEVIENETPFLSFRKYNDIPFIRHCFTTKEGGVSKDIFESLNLSFSRGDDYEAVKQNYINICNSCGFNVRNIVMSDQVHKTTVLQITKEVLSELDKDDFTKRKLNCVDGMVTNLKDVPLFTYYADCVPLYFVDVNKKAVGLSHSGWRGTSGLMGLKTVQKMVECFDTDTQDLICAIGPSICQECYEVSQDVIDEITDSFLSNGIITRMDDFIDIYYKKTNGKYQLDLWQANKKVLLKAGVLPENIIISNICTCHNKEVLFSHRATNGKRGNLAAAISII